MTTQKRFQIVLWFGLTSGTFPAIIVQGQSCDPGINNNWQGGFSNRWNDQGNWFLGVPPGPSHHVIFDMPASTIMDLLGTFPEGRKVCSVTAMAPGETAFGAAATGDWFQRTRLYLDGDLKRDNAINDHVMRLGPWDGVFVGKPAPEFPLGLPYGPGETYGFQWLLQGEFSGFGFRPAVVLVTDTIGCGRWDAQIANIGVGFKYSSIEDGLITDETMPDALGVVNALVCGVPEQPPYIDNIWTLDGVTFRAKRCESLGVWTVTETLGRPNDFEIEGYFRANSMTFSGKWQSSFKVGVTGNTYPDTGLDFLNNNVSFEGPSNPSFKGPTVTVEGLQVTTNGQLHLSDGVDFHVAGWAEHATNEDFVTLSTHALFGYTGSLRYGPRMGTDQSGCDDFQCEPGYQDCFPCQPITLFEVQDQYDNPRTPALRFEDKSYITTVNPIPASGQTDQELELRLRTHLDVESVVTQTPAIQWYTAEVNLVVEPPSNLTVACGFDGIGCPAEIETFSADSCNVWFTDVPEPRSLKAWRNFHAKERNFVPAYTKLVDRHDNDRPIAGDPCPPGEAMYVSGDVVIDVGENNPLDLTNHRVYYGDVLTVDSIDQSPCYIGYAPVKLIKTECGDFNGDCVVNAVDASFFPQVPPGGSIQAPLPFFDYDGDGDVDGVEVALLQSRMNQSVTCTPGPDPWSCLPLCPQQGSCGDASLYLKVQGLPDWLPIALKVKGISSDVACVGTSSNPKYVNANGTLGATPVFRTASQWGVVWIGGPELIPDATYEVQVHYGAAGLSAPRSFKTSLFGDTFGEPDGNCIVDSDDILHVLNAFMTCPEPTFPDCSFYPNDVVQLLGGPYHIVDVDDIIGVLMAFEGASYGCYVPIGPCGNLGCTGGTAPAQGGHGFQCIQATVKAIAPTGSIQPGATVNIEAKITCINPARGFQTAFNVTGGTSGTLTLESITINTGHLNAQGQHDYLFYGLSDIRAESELTGRAAAALYVGGTATSPLKYFSTFIFRASSNASGTFTIQVRPADTKLRGPSGQPLPWVPGPAATITVNGL